MMHAGYDDDAHRDPYEESYDPEPYPAFPQATHQQPTEAYYPNGNHFPPPPGTTPNLNATPQPYNPADYPPPPGAAPPPQPYNYGAANAGPETYAPRPRRADENVSAPSSSTTLPTKQTHAHDGAFTATSSGAVPKNPRLTAGPSGVNIRPPSQSPPSTPRTDAPQSSSSKSVAFNLDSESQKPADPGYETDNSDSTIDEYTPGHRTSSSFHPRSSSGSSARFNDHRSRFGAGAGAGVGVVSSSSSSASPHRHSSDRHFHSNSHRSQRDSHRDSTSSDSTIELPERFDSKGRLLTQTENSSVEKLENFMKKVAQVLI